MSQDYYWLIPVFLLIVILLAAVIVLSYTNLLKLRAIRLLQAEVENMAEEFSRLEEELKFTRIKAEESDRLKTAFLCNISHEIRTPLHAILGFSGLIANEAIPDTDKVKYAKIISRNVDTLMDLVNDILDVSQYEAEGGKITEEEINLNEILSSVHTWLLMEKDSAGKDQIQVKVIKPAKDSEILLYSDYYKLKRILFHLAGNALKYSQRGFIELGYQFVSNKRIEIYVKDEGIGFSRDKLEQIFQHFRQVDESDSRQYQGLGLGLTIAQKFIRSLGGELNADSEPGKGSSFWFSLPYRKQTLTNPT